MKTQKDTIKDLFFINHLKVKEIAQIVNTSSAYITKVVKKDSRYTNEKEFRKTIASQNKKVAKMGGHAAKVAREDIEKSLGESVVSKNNALNYKYLENNKLDKQNKLNSSNKKRIRENNNTEKQ